MKFENPIMNISMFEVDDVITMSGGAPTYENEAQSLAAEAIATSHAEATQVILKFTNPNQ